MGINLFGFFNIHEGIIKMDDIQEFIYRWMDTKEKHTFEYNTIKRAVNDLKECKTDREVLNILNSLFRRMDYDGYLIN